jgi:hypothetical protein
MCADASLDKEQFAQWIGCTDTKKVTERRLFEADKNRWQLTGEEQDMAMGAGRCLCQTFGNVNWSLILFFVMRLVATLFAGAAVCHFRESQI